MMLLLGASDVKRAPASEGGRDNAAGKVENQLMSGLDWFPAPVAAAGNPTIADELKKGKQVGDRTYKVYLDGYNQLDLLRGVGKSKRNEVFYFAETTLGAVRIGDYKKGKPEKRLQARPGQKQVAEKGPRWDPFQQPADFPTPCWGASLAGIECIDVGIDGGR